MHTEMFSINFTDLPIKVLWKVHLHKMNITWFAAVEHLLKASFFIVLTYQIIQHLYRSFNITNLR